MVKAPNNNARTLTTTTSISVFSNPTSNSLSVTNGNEQAMNLTVVNLFERSVFFGNVKMGSKTSIDLARFGKGNYHVTATYEDGRVVTKPIMVK